MASCRVCTKRMLSHARRLICCNCNNRVHLTCLPRVSVEDSLYKNRDKTDWICPICIQDALPYNHLDEDDFIESISELWKFDSILPLDSIQSSNYIFCPFELNEDVELPLQDIDPDMQFYNNQCKTYFNLDKNSNRMNILLRQRLFCV